MTAGKWPDSNNPTLQELATSRVSGVRSDIQEAEDVDLVNVLGAGSCKGENGPSKFKKGDV
jgi:hypothetical protein